MKLENRYTKEQMIENINECNEDDNLSVKRKGLSFLQELLEQYKYGDILAIADCLQKDAKQFIEEYYGTNQKENSGLGHEYI